MVLENTTPSNTKARMGTIVVHSAYFGSTPSNTRNRKYFRKWLI
jgi:hypothetical protein